MGQNVNENKAMTKVVIAKMFFNNSQDASNCIGDKLQNIK